MDNVIFIETYNRHQYQVENMVGDTLHYYEIIEGFVQPEYLENILQLLSQFNNIDIYLLNSNMRLTTNLPDIYERKQTTISFNNITFYELLPQNIFSLPHFERLYDEPITTHQNYRDRPFMYNAENIHKIYHMQQYNTFTFIVLINKNLNFKLGLELHLFIRNLAKN